MQGTNKSNKKEKQLVEDLAILQHEIFSEWMSYFFSGIDEKYRRMMCLRLIKTPYSRLRNKEREKYQDSAARLMIIFKKYR